MSLKSLIKQAVDLNAGNEYWIQVLDGGSLGDSFFLVYREHSGSVVGCLTRDRKVTVLSSSASLGCGP